MKIKFSFKFCLFVTLILIIYNHYFNLKLLQFSCPWPSENGKKVLVIADTHITFVWKFNLDRIVRHWEMKNNFEKIVKIYNPDKIYILGDIFDAGLYFEAQHYRYMMNEFNYIFGSTKIIKIAGNHDIGYHDDKYTLNRHLFNRNFGSMDVHIDIYNESSILSLNSMSLKFDECNFCKRSMNKIKSFSRKIQKDHLNRPVVLMHFPLYRTSERDCNVYKPFWITEEIHHIPNNDILSKKSSEFLLQQINPQILITGHMHFHCEIKRTYFNDILTEVNIPSFSFRMNYRAGFALITLDKIPQYSVCELPTEYIFFSIYVFIFFMWFSKLFIYFKCKCM
ncbi:Metallophosphoesterase 1, partial [Intoshia linei]